MDWVHCNNCCIQPCQGPDKPRFLLTNCGHIICKKCSLECTNNKCRVCGSTYKAVLLTSKMKPEIERFFMNPLDLLKRSINEVQSVTDFQQGHRTRLLEQLGRCIRQHETAIKEYDAKCRCQQQQLRRLEEQLRHQQQQQHHRAIGYSPSNTFPAGTVASRPYRRTPQGMTASAPTAGGDWMPAAAAHYHHHQHQQRAPNSAGQHRPGGGGEPRASPYMDLARRHFQPSPFATAPGGATTAVNSSTAAATSAGGAINHCHTPLPPPEGGTISPAHQPSQTLLAKLFASPAPPRTHNFI